MSKVINYAATLNCGQLEKLVEDLNKNELITQHENEKNGGPYSGYKALQPGKFETLNSINIFSQTKKHLR